MVKKSWIFVACLSMGFIFGSEHSAEAVRTSSSGLSHSGNWAKSNRRSRLGLGGHRSQNLKEIPNGKEDLRKKIIEGQMKKRAVEQQAGPTPPPIPQRGDHLLPGPNRGHRRPLAPPRKESLISEGDLMYMQSWIPSLNRIVDRLNSSNEPHIIEQKAKTIVNTLVAFNKKMATYQLVDFKELVFIIENILDRINLNKLSERQLANINTFLKALGSTTVLEKKVYARELPVEPYDAEKITYQSPPITLVYKKIELVNAIIDGRIINGDHVRLEIINPTEHQVKVRIRLEYAGNELVPYRPKEPSADLELHGNSADYLLPSDSSIIIDQYGLTKEGKYIISLWPDKYQLAPDLDEQGKPEPLSPRNKEFGHFEEVPFPAEGIHMMTRMEIKGLNELNKKVQIARENWEGSLNEEPPESDDAYIQEYLFVPDASAVGSPRGHTKN